MYGYCRVSTLKQAEDGESLAIQQRQLEGYAIMHGLAIDRIFVERAVSGSVPINERPEGKALFALLEKGDVVMSPKLDRLFRSALDALVVVEDLRKRGVALHLLDLGGDIATNGLSKLFLTIAAAFAEAERDRIRERVGQTKVDQRAQGRFLGGVVPFGYRREGELLLVDREQQKAIREIKRLRAQGKALRAIAEAMKAKGVVISHAGVSNVLKATARPTGERAA